MSSIDFETFTDKIVLIHSKKKTIDQSFLRLFGCKHSQDPKFYVKKPSKREHRQATTNQI